MSVSRISQIMHCGILIDTPHLLTKHNNPLHIFFQSLKYKPVLGYIYFMFVELFLSFHMMCPGVFVVKMVGQITTNQDAVGKAHTNTRAIRIFRFFHTQTLIVEKKLFWCLSVLLETRAARMHFFR